VSRIAKSFESTTIVSEIWVKGLVVGEAYVARKQMSCRRDV
jgi:hypothetical protein